ncbi:hypothetical protein D3C81_1564100 [compost metagenome]
MPGAQVVDGKVDDLRDAGALAIDQQVQGRRQLHETRNYPTVNRWQQRVTNVVRAGGQAKQQILTLAFAFDADQAGVGDQCQQRPIVAERMGRIQLLTHLVRDHAPPSLRLLPKRMPPLICGPRRMNVPTTWQIGWLGSSW